MTEKIISMIKNGEVPFQYRDPQEFMWCENRTPESDVYSYGMMIFNMIAGKDYFDYTGIPADEYFMMADTDSDESVINEKYNSDEMKFIFPLLKKMTVYRRSSRIALSEVMKELESMAEKSEKEAPENVQTVCDDDAELSPDSSTISTDNPLSVKPDYDYGIILNNKRSGRIEFRVLLGFDGRTENCDIPVYEPGVFRIAVSRRHRDHADISNPSSVFGDSIIPVGVIRAENVSEGKLRISAENSGGELMIKISETDLQGTGKKTDSGWESTVC